MEAYPISKIKLPGKEQILQRFDRLLGGESMTISNTHNPYILYYQLLKDRGATFSWEYLERGPLRWRVRITRQNKTGS